MQKETKKAIMTFLGILMLTVGTVFGVLAVQSKVVFHERAAEDPTTASKIAEIAKSIGQNSYTSSTTYTSNNLGYQVSIDKNYWLPSENTDLKKTDLQKLSFSLNNNAGVAKVDFSVSDSKDLQSRIAKEKAKNPDVNLDNLDLLASSIAKENPPVSKLRLRRNGRDFYKFTYNTKFLNQTTSYFTYITLGDNSYYSITARYPSFGDGEALSEQLIDSFNFLPQNPSVKGVSATSLPTTALDESKIVELTKPSVVEIAHLYCNDIKIGDTNGLRYLKQNYNFCDGALGSGFVINKDGYVATNGHVAKQYPESSLIQGLLSSNPLSQPFFVDLIRELVVIQTGQEISEDQAKALLSQTKTDPSYFESFVTLIYKMIQQKIMTVAVNQDKHFIKLANDPIVLNQEKLRNDFVNSVEVSETIKEAQLVSYNYPDQLSVESVLNNKKELGSDVAIIKITNPSGMIYPSLTLGTSEGLKEGSPIIVIGYPGLVSGNSGDSLVNLKSSATPTITKGVISAIKNDQGGLKLIQVDASIDHGNSGGPAFDSAGNVIGIATYGIGSQSGNYNFLRDIEDLKKLAGENSVNAEPSPTYISWAEGLNYFWREHYKQAVIPFDKVEANYPIHPLAANYVNDSQEAIQKGQDKSDFAFLLVHDRKTQIVVFGTILLIAIVGSLIIILIKKRKAQSMGQNPPPNTILSTTNQSNNYQSSSPLTNTSEPTNPQVTQNTPANNGNPLQS